MKIKTIKSLVDEAMKVVNTIEPKKAKTFLELDNHLLIDIRDIRELWKLGTIEGARHIPRGMLEFWLDPESPYFKSDLKVDMVKILYCASNWRSALASKALMEMGFTNVMHVQGGFQALVDAGFSVQKIESK
ncbi:rhodanese-like domain-containing protein [Pelagibacteraceae bacterium]|nr:rhodanese-like domain-containing protein [Pelagibacteraceae bacterium]|tara:strand:+ start:1564 stop:1959 length:396 start_codon:yes stop_codon:yes gene_type:complete